MKNLTMATLIAAIAFAAPAFAEDAHHPDAAVSAPKAAKVGPSNMQAKETIGKMDQQMKEMQKMHQQMMDAKTPEERNVLMADHMKAMQGGMSMMGGMSAESKEKMKGRMPSDPAARQQMMEKRMDMMESMMQMMMDRLPPAGAK